MYLKKLEIQGFKSFANKTEIEFKDNITAIVGPNGSGKSNISDAIRWALGEQSAKNLRGGKMEDIIFSGTAKRRALGYAEVTMFFDNTSNHIPLDYNEVAITRRVFRSGESEYYINKSSCRLKDIRALFMDTGIGKDGYSIIGQGKIDEILSNRPEDRRGIFEEAAGIIKYKSKKEESERKLDRTEANLIRIKDLTLEVGKQERNLEIESKKAKRFTKLYEELKILDVSMYINEIDRLNSLKDKAYNEILEIDKEVSIIQIKKDNIENKFNILKTETQDMDGKIEKTRNKKYDKIQILEKNKNEVSILEEKQGYFTRDLDRLEAEKEELWKSLEDLSNIIIEIESKKKSIKDEYENLYNDYNVKNAELDKINELVSNKEELIESKKDDLIAIYNKASETRSELNGINTFNDNISKRMEQLNNRVIDIQESKNTNINNLSKLSSEKTKIKKNLEEHKILVESIEKDRALMEDKYNKTSEKLRLNQIKLQGQVSSYNLYNSMERGYEGYYSSVKNLLKAVDKSNELGQGYIGLVADLIRVKDKYEKAIEISLGSSAQNFVMETDLDAKRMIEYLKTHGLGRVTFLPLNTIKGNVLRLNIEQMKKEGVLGLGHNLIEYEEKHKNILEYLLGRTIIIDNLNNGLNVSKKYGHIYRIVTLDGDVLNPGGSLTGGSYNKNATSIISRKNKITKLGKEIDKLKKIIENMEEEKTNLKNDLNKLDNNIVSLETTINNINLDLINTSNEQKSIEKEVERLDKELANSNSEIKLLESESIDFFRRKKDYLEMLEGIQEDTNRLKSNIDELTKDLGEIKELKEEKSRNLMEFKININRIENSLNNIKEKKEHSHLEIESTKALILEKDNLINSLKEQLEEVHTKKTLLLEDIENQEKEKLEIDEILNTLLKEKENLMKTFYEEQEILKNINKTLSQIEKTKNKEEISKARYELQLENNHRYLMDEYDLTYELGIKHKEEIKNIKETKKRIKILKSEIKSIGNVNLGSIEEYTEVKERLDFLTIQQNDLITGKEDLKKVINNMEIEMTNQFVKSFKEINTNFKEVFSMLFNGGNASLVLEDEANILNSGIEINVQPPGKKLQSLSLLSGGEKSLTAVALLFAILKTKPAPFCILDEIDAALDEANINRYTSYLKSINDDTQFILITHRKTTMEIADVLYGVTMEEEGISKLLSVKLKDELDEIIAS